MNKFGKRIPRKWHQPGGRKYPERVYGVLDIIPLGLHQYNLRPSGTFLFSGANPVADYLLGSDRRAIQQSEQHLKSLIEAAPLGLHQYELLADGRLIFSGANPAADRILGLDHQTLIGLAIEDAFPTLRQTAIPAIYRQVAQDGEPYFCEQSAYQDEQIQGVYEIQAFQTGPSRMAVFFQDITTKKIAEDALRESEERYRRLFEDSLLGIFQSSPQGKVLAVNPAFAHMFGYDSSEEVMATVKNVATDIFFDPNRRAEITRMVAENPDLHSFENLYQHKDGSPFPGTLHLHPVMDADNRLLYFEGLIEDTTQKKQAEEKIRDLARFPEENPYPVARINREGVLLFANRIATPMLAALGDQIGGTLSTLWWEYAIPVFESGQTKEVEFTFGDKVFSLSLVPIPGEAYLNIYGLDITERKRSELDLRRRIIEIEALHAVALAGMEATSPDELLDRVAKIIREELYPDHFGVSFLDDQNQVLTLHTSFVQNPLQAAYPIPVSHGIIGRTVRTGLPQRVGDVRLDPDYLEGSSDTLSELCVPLMIGRRVIGVINLENTTLGSFTEADERLVIAIASELGTALEKIHLLQEEQNRRNELEAIEQISAVLRIEEDKNEVLQSVLERVMKVMALQGAGIILMDPITGELGLEVGKGDWALAKESHLIRGEGIISKQVASSQHYYLNNKLRSDPRLRWPDASPPLKALLCLALIVDGQTHGLLYLGRNTDFLPLDVHLAITITDALAGALHRIELHTQTQRQLERLTALRAIDQSILSRLDLEHTLEVLLEKITGLLQVDAANFLLYQPKRQILTIAARRGLHSEFIWDASQDLRETHAGRAALSLQIQFLPDLSQMDDGLTQKLDRIGEKFVSYLAVPLLARGELKGVLQIFHRSPLKPDRDWMGFLETLSDQAAIAINSALLFKDQEQTNTRLTKAYEDTIDGWSRALDLRDKETEGHSERVTDLTMELARRMNVPEEQLVHIRRGAKLHDIGKMGIPDRILLKPGKLTPEEWEIMRRHPIFAADLLYPIEFLAPALEIPFGHHEKWDGSGYPQGLKGEEIMLSARIFAVIDVWDALTHDRPYRFAWSETDALRYIREQAGKHFDARVVQEFMAMAQEGLLHPYADKR